jgi:hypothetical protein
MILKRVLFLWRTKNQLDHKKYTCIYSFKYKGKVKTAYPVVCIRVFGIGDNEGIMIPVSINQKSKEIEIKGLQVKIMGAHRYYIPELGIWEKSTPIYLAPSPVEHGPL